MRRYSIASALLRNLAAPHSSGVPDNVDAGRADQHDAHVPAEPGAHRLEADAGPTEPRDPPEE